MGKRKTLEQQFPNDKATVSWLKVQAKGTQNTFKHYWKWFLEYTKMNGSQILEARKKAQLGIWENKVLAFHKWSQQHTCEIHENPLSQNSAKTAVGTVRSFFAYFYVPLAIRRADTKKISETEALIPDYKFTRKDIGKMAMQGSIKERYVVVVGKSIGFRAGDFIKFKLEDFQQALKNSEFEDAPIPLGEFTTQKRKEKAYPFIDKDALPIVEAYLSTLKSKGKKPTDRMLEIKQSELTAIVQRLAKKANLPIKSNERVRFHCLRAFLSNHLSSVMAESKWKQVIGKAIGEGAYVGIAELRESYKRAMDSSCYSNNNHKTVRIGELEKENETLRTILVSIIGKDKIQKALAGNVALQSGTVEELPIKKLLELYAQTL